MIIHECILMKTECYDITCGGEPDCRLVNFRAIAHQSREGCRGAHTVEANAESRALVWSVGADRPRPGRHPVYARGAARHRAVLERAQLSRHAAAPVGGALFPAR